MKYTDRKVENPLCAISTKSSLLNKTGSWRFAKPVFVDRVSPCSRQCPAGEDITGYMYLAGQGRFEDAWRLIMKENPFPAVMGRVCFHSCEEKCNRANHDEPVSINMVERYIGDYGLAHHLKVKQEKPDTGKDVAIIGAGPAGLAAAYHLRLTGYGVAVFDANEFPGGLMRYGIPPYRLPKEILDGEIDRLSDMGIDFKMGMKVGEDVTWEEIDGRFDATFISIGAYQEAGLDIKGLEKKGVLNALDLLRETNFGIEPEIGKKVAVIGGGNSALDCARVSRRLGSDVTVIYRRSEAEMPAHPEEIEMAREEGVQFIFLAGPKEIFGNGSVKGVRLDKMKLGEPDASGRRRPIATGEAFDFDCRTVILAIGESTRTEDLPPFITLKGKVVETDDSGQTSNPNYFAGGDIIDIPHTVTHAIGSGKRSAIDIDRLLMGTKKVDETLNPFSELFPRRNPDSEEVDYNNLNLFYFDHRPRLKNLIVTIDRRVSSFDEVVVTPDKDNVIAEARRCFNCGSCTECGNCFIFCPDISIKKDPGGYGYVIDMDYCKGCGICVQECPRGAMKMEFME
ncbi:MAG TPA: glutamate synthase [Desulfobacteraceae bacterium]|nr:glutamate synthase [Desulfobacteraceae bacterium]